MPSFYTRPAQGNNRHKFNMRDVGRHANVHEMPRLKHGRYSKLDSLHSMDNVISTGAGYDRDDCYGDFVAAFSDDYKESRLDLRGQVREWKASSLLTPSGDPGKMSMERAEHRAAQFYKFMHRFTRSEQRDNFLKMANNDPELAAQAMMEYINKSGENGQCRFGLGDSDGIGGLGKALGMEEYGGDGAGDAPLGGEQAGNSNPELIADIMRIAELLPRLRRKYSFAAGRSFTREVSPYPADDMDIRPMQSFAEIMRVPTAKLAMDDDLFYLAAIQKQLPVVEHYKLNPVTRHFGLAIDVSGSMKQFMNGGYRRSEYATAVAIAMLEQAERGGNRVSMVRFDGRAHPPCVGTPREVAAEVWKCQFSGGGTAFQPVFDFFDSLESCELGVLITDGEAGYEKASKVPFQVLSCGESDYSGSIKRLRNDATKYDVVK